MKVFEGHWQDSSAWFHSARLFFRLNACATCHALPCQDCQDAAVWGNQHLDIRECARQATEVMAANHLFLKMSATESLCGSLNQFQKGLKWSPRMTHAVCFLSTRAIEALEQPLVPAFKHWTEIYRWNCFPTVHVRNSKPWHCGHGGLCVLLHRYVPCSCYPYPVIHMEKCKSATWKTESRHNFCISHGAGHLPRAKQLPCCDARLGSSRTSNQGI